MTEARFTDKFWHKPAVFVSIGFGTGLFPRAPGTFASLVLAVIWWFFVANLQDTVQWVILLLFLVGGFLAVRRSVEVHGAADEPEITIDEMAGQALALVFAPLEVWCYVLAFLVFRLFDIWKPFPIRYLDRELKGAIGIMADDILAGLIAAFVTLMSYFLWLYLQVG